MELPHRALARLSLGAALLVVAALLGAAVAPSALAADPDLRVFHACGYFDLLGGCYASDYAARHVAPALPPRITSPDAPGFRTRSACSSIGPMTSTFFAQFSKPRASISIL